jgi:hypothetical protein
MQTDYCDHFAEALRKANSASHPKARHAYMQLAEFYQTRAIKTLQRFSIMALAECLSSKSTATPDPLIDRSIYSERIRSKCAGSFWYDYSGPGKERSAH